MGEMNGARALVIDDLISTGGITLRAAEAAFITGTSAK